MVILKITIHGVNISKPGGKLRGSSPLLRLPSIHPAQSTRSNSMDMQLLTATRSQWPLRVVIVDTRRVLFWNLPCRKLLATDKKRNLQKQQPRVCCVLNFFQKLDQKWIHRRIGLCASIWTYRSTLLLLHKIINLLSTLYQSLSAFFSVI